MEAYGALELLSRGLGSTRPVADCTRSFRELSLANNSEGLEGTKLEGASVQYGSALPSSQGPSGGLGGAHLNSGADVRTPAGDPPLSRPISAPPNLGAIRASTLFAYPPAESAGCVDFLLGDIRYDKQYCEFYR